MEGKGMLASREEERWSLTPHSERGYTNREEKAFFEAIENPPPPTEDLKDVYRRYARYLKEDG